MTIIPHFLRHLRARNLRPSTIYSRHRCMIRLADALDVPLLDATEEMLLDRLDNLAVQPESRAAELACYRSFYRWAHAAGRIDRDPTAFIPRPRVPRRLPRPMSKTALVDALDNGPDRVRLAVTLAAYAGLRACEIAQLRGEDCHATADPPIIRIETGKGGDASAVPMHPALADELRGWPPSGPLFPWRGDGNAPAHLVSQTVNVWLHRRGHPDTLHMARHWFGTHVYKTSGRDLRATQELLRHRSVTSTQIYTWIDPGPLSSAVDGLPMVA